MTEDATAEMTALEAELAELVFERFEHDEATAVGEAVMRRAAEEGWPIAVDVRRPGQILYHRAAPGATPDNDRWIDGKTAVVFRFEASSLLMARRIRADVEAGRLPPGYDPAGHALAGGAFPIRVRGAGVVAAVTVSGLPETEDHALVVGVLRDLLRTQQG